jgi:tripartite-type tricarboxylate transporter receptor subunit TctC
MKRTKLTVWLLFLYALAISLAINIEVSAAEKDYPQKPIRIIVPFPPGADADIIARAVAQVAPKYLGGSMTVVNIAGGGGTIGVAEAAKAAPDGYTIVFAPGGPIATQPHLNPVPYKIPDDFVAIAQLQDFPLAMAVKADAPCNDLKGFVQWAHREPKGLVYGGVPGGIPSLTMELFRMKSKINLRLVAYTGTAPAMTALLGGHIQAVCAPPPGFVSFLQNKQVKVLGTSSLTPFDIAGESVPAFKEQGFDVVVYYRNGILAPKGTPVPVVKKLEEFFRKISFESAEYKDLEKKFAFGINFKNASEFFDLWMQDYKLFGEIIRESDKK